MMSGLPDVVLTNMLLRGRGTAESQGRPAHPALETLFRQAGACVTQLGLLGVGAAAFADVRREFVEG